MAVPFSTSIRGVLVRAEVIEEFLHILISRLHPSEIPSMVVKNVGVSSGAVLMILNNLIVCQLVKAIPSSGEIDGDLVVPWGEEGG